MSHRDDILRAGAAVRANPRDPALWVELGNLLAKAGDRNKARDCYERALKLGPGHVGAREGLEWLKPQSPPPKSVLPQASEVGEAALPKPQRPSLPRKLQMATFLATLALATNSRDPSRWVKVGNLLAEASNLDKARDCYEYALKLEPGHIGAREGLEWLKLQSPPSESARPQVTEAGEAALLGPQQLSLPRWQHVAADLAMFLVTVVLATSQQWSVTDLVWSLWLSSLILGYAYITTSIIAMLLTGDMRSIVGASSEVPIVLVALPINVMLLIVLFLVIGLSRITLAFTILVIVSSILSLGSEVRRKLGLGFLPDSENTLVRIIVSLPTVLFMLGFFSFHFLFFHAGHGLILNIFFPLLRESPFGKTPGEMKVFFQTLFTLALSNYWPIVITSALSRLDHYAAAFRATGPWMLFMPYKNVMRMHLMIFVFAFMGIAGLTSYALYPILILYFFPVGSLLRRYRAER